MRSLAAWFLLVASALAQVSVLSGTSSQLSGKPLMIFSNSCTHHIEIKCGFFYAYDVEGEGREHTRLALSVIDLFQPPPSCATGHFYFALVDYELFLWNWETNRMEHDRWYSPDESVDACDFSAEISGNHPDWLRQFNYGVH